jgi:membrane peptidoglycan carboxypeptidase
MIPYTGSLNTPIIEAIIAIEDNRFWEHGGIDFYGKMGSIWENIRASRIVRGGSTITEQYIKNLYYP